MASTYLTRTSSSTGNRKTWTLSAWVKRTAVGVKHGIFGTYTDGNNRLDFAIDANDKLTMKEKASSTNIDFTSTAKFRDIAAWYHFVFKVDTTQASASDRVKIYVNGSEITDWVDNTQPSQNYDTFMNVSGRSYLIGQTGGNTNYWDGLISHINLTDGAAYTPSTFGSTDATSGNWQIDTSPSVSYGTNGFFICKDGNGITDQSGQSNNFTVGGGNFLNVKDTPSNNFPILNILNVQSTGYTIANCARSVTANTGGAFRTMYGTIGAVSGKFYWEMKVTGTNGSDPMNMRFGIVDADQMDQTNGTFHNESRGYAYTGNSGNIQNGSSNTSYGNTYTTNDIIGCAVDLDNSKLYFSKNGVFQNSGDPTSGSTGTGAAATIASGFFYIPAMESYYTQDTYTFNFGDGYFGTTAVSSAGTNASGNGVFEYDVPTGYTALCTKGLNE